MSNSVFASARKRKRQPGGTCRSSRRGNASSSVFSSTNVHQNAFAGRRPAPSFWNANAPRRQGSALRSAACAGRRIFALRSRTGYVGARPNQSRSSSSVMFSRPSASMWRTSSHARRICEPRTCSSTSFSYAPEQTHARISSSDGARLPAASCVPFLSAIAASPFRKRRSSPARECRSGFATFFPA